MGITYGDYLIDSGYRELTEEQERAIEDRAACSADYHQYERLVQRLEDVEQAFAQAYYFVKGEPPKWSKTFGYNAALEDIKDACALLRSKRNNSTSL